MNNCTPNDYKTNIDEIIHTYSDMVYRIAFLNMKHKSDAEDIFQEVFLKLIENADKLKNTEHVKAWLIRVTINLCKNNWKSHWKRRTVFEVTNTLSVEEDFEINKQGIVYEAVQSLPQKYRNVIHLFYFEDMTTEAISNTLNIKNSTVRAQLLRGKKLLKKMLVGVADDEII